MTLTYTNEPYSMVNHYECEVAVKALLAEKTILFPTDTVWSVGCLPYAITGLDQLFNLKRSKSPENFEVLFDSIERLKFFAPNLHPRIETLLVFHHRPLTIVLKGLVGLPDTIINEEQEVNVRIVQDALTKTLIEEADAPIISIAACSAAEEFPAGFGAIRSDFLQGVDYIMKIRQRDLMEKAQLSVKIKLEEGGDFVFLRD